MREAKERTPLSIAEARRIDLEDHLRWLEEGIEQGKAENDVGSIRVFTARYREVREELGLERSYHLPLRERRNGHKEKKRF